MHGGKIPCAERELAGNCRPSCMSSLGLLFADGAKMSGQNGHSSSFFGAMSARDARNEVVSVVRDNHIFPTKKESNEKHPLAKPSENELFLTLLSNF